MNHFLRFAFATAILFVATAHLAAETVTWIPERTIEVPIKVSVSDEIYPRTLIFTGAGEILPIDQWWSDRQIEITRERNTITIRLRDPLFRGNIALFDNKGNLVSLLIHSVDRDHALDPVLVVTPESSSTAQNQIPLDTDNSAIVLARHMTGGQRHPAIQESSCSHVAGNATLPGEYIVRSESLVVMRMRVYQSPNLRGYLYTYTWHGPEACRINLQQLKPKGGLFMTAPTMVVMPENDSYLTLPPGQTIPVWYVCR